MNLKIFPKREYNLRYRFDCEKAIEYMVLNTKNSDRLFSQATSKSFIGKVNKQGFRLISSKPGKGPFCVLNGTFSTDNCKLNVQVNKPFKLLTGIMVLIMSATVIIQLITKPSWENIALLVPIGMFVVGGNWYLKAIFKKSLSLSVNKLNEILIFQS